MRVAAGQFAVTPVWRTNAQTCVTMMQQAAREGAALLVLPEALLARDDNDPDMSVKSAQPLDGLICLRAYLCHKHRISKRNPESFALSDRIMCNSLVPP